MSPEASAMAFAAAARQALTSEDHASVKLYAARADLRRELPPPLSEREVSPTEVVVVASEMIRVVDLNPFDLSMWYRRAR